MLQPLIINALLFVLPFLVFPISATPFETIKVFVAEILIGILVLTTILKNGFSFRKIAKPQLLIILVIFFLSLIDLLLFGRDITFFGNQFRLQGTFLLWILLGFAIVIGTNAKRKIPHLFTAIAFVVLVIVSILFGADINGRLIGTIGEANALSAFVLFIFPFVFLGRFSKFDFKIVKILVWIISLLLVVFTGSRSGLIGFFIENFLIFSNYKLKLSLSVISFISTVLIIISFSLPFLGTKIIHESRTDIWETAFKVGFNRPVVGGGFGNTEYILREGGNILRNNLRYEYVDSSHNIFLDWWVQGGIAGEIAFLSLLFFTVRKFILTKRVLELTVLFGLLTAISFNPASVVSLVQLWFLIGIGLS